MLVGSEIGNSRRIVFCASFRSSINDGKYSVTGFGVGNGLIVDQKLFAAEEGNARPVDELGRILLRVTSVAIHPPLCPALPISLRSFCSMSAGPSTAKPATLSTCRVMSGPS